jgi:hypothetical protein
MAGRSQGRRRSKRAVRYDPLPPEVQARHDRRLAILLGFTPLREMTQEEADWVFEQKLRIGSDR